MPETMMAREIRQIPDTVERQMSEAGAIYREIGSLLRRRDPAVVVTAARGSSDHAALYLKYLIETRLGRPVASMGPSVASVYRTPLRLEGAAMIAISQSGASPDLLSLIDAGRNCGALTIALVNAEDAPAGRHAELLAPLRAGLEVAVAATKSYVASLAASAAIVAEWAEDRELLDALRALPEALENVLSCDWGDATAAFAAPGSAFCVGRSTGLSVAAEAALKFKETCGLHAEAYSSAEVLHGPVTLGGPDLRCLFFVPSDESRAGVVESAARLRETGADVWMVGDGAGQHLDAGRAPHPALQPLCQALAFYVFVERLARTIGRDPDKPAYLNKVTRTV